MIRQGNSEPPVWSRAKMLRTGAALALGICLAAAVLLTGSRFGLRQRKIDQKIERLARGMLQTHAAIESFYRKHGHYPEAVDGALPPEFTRFQAEELGGRPFHEEQARVATLDFFGQNPNADRLFYATDGRHWILNSRGPDGDFDIKGINDNFTPHSYDPTNGAESNGDFFVTNRKD